MPLLSDRFEHHFEGGVTGQGDHFRTRGHDLLDARIAELDHRFDHLLFFLVNRSVALAFAHDTEISCSNWSA